MNSMNMGKLFRYKVAFATIILFWLVSTIFYYGSVLFHNDLLEVNEFEEEAREDFTENPIGKGNLYRENVSIAVLMIACSRSKLLLEALDRLILIREATRRKFAQQFPNNTRIENLARLPLAVSQGCPSYATKKVILDRLRKDNDNGVRAHFQYPEENTILNPNLRNNDPFQGYYRIACHYKWAIEEAFRFFPTANSLIIVEDDLQFSNDFFEYFLTLEPLLLRDKNLLCISAWNDNGKEHLIDSRAISLLYKTDFFPGLGWMLKRSTWEEIRDEWPPALWDDWLRHSHRRKNRSCIRPEISRTSTVGRVGVSKGQFFDTHLVHIKHSSQYYPFFEHQTELIRYLSEDFERNFLHAVYEESEPIHPIRMKLMEPAAGSNLTYRVTYFSKQEFITYANMYDLMADFKYGIPRTAFNGIVTGYYRGHRLFLAPPPTRTHYIQSWI